MEFFTRTLLKWHEVNPRQLPWSTGSRDPYAIWLSEIIMQQTRIEQGTAYYLKFIEEYPSVADLAEAPLNEIMKLWEGLGYYTRARNLHKAAQHITQHLNGLFPDDYESLITLPGIGPYSAAAISSFAYGHAHAVVDGNVKRLIARFAGVTTSIDDATTHNQIRMIAEKYMKRADPALFNQAIMNFGALVCKPKPLCPVCPLAKKCFALKHDMVLSLPVRTKKKPNRLRFFHFLLVYYNNKLLLQRREANDIWKGLYAPLLIESKATRAPSLSQIKEMLLHVVGHVDIRRGTSSQEFQQLLSHQTISGRYHEIQLLQKPNKLDDPYMWVTRKTIQDVGKPRMIVDMLAQVTAVQKK